MPNIANNLYHYKVIVVDVYDGDTITVDIDVGLGIWVHKQKIRLIGINAPEMRGNQKVEGKAAKDRLREILAGSKQIYIQTIAKSDQPEKKGKYGRWLAYVFLEDGTNVNQQMVKEGYAKEYIL